MSISLNSPKYAVVNSLSYQMHKKQQDRKKRKASLPRYFRLNEGTTDGYETSARLIPDPKLYFDVEINLIGDVDQAGTFVSQNTSGGSKELHIFQDNGGLGLIVGGDRTNFSSKILVAGTYRFINDGVNYTLFKNGTLVESIVALIGVISEPSATFTIGTRHGNSLIDYGFGYSGVIADVVLRNPSGAITNGYDINSNSNDVPDNTGSADAVVVNGNVNDWGPFKEQPTLWKGQGLTVPPWASVDQELIKA